MAKCEQLGTLEEHVGIIVLVITFCRFEILLNKKSGKRVVTEENWEV